jgi:hypothetical protein
LLLPPEQAPNPDANILATVPGACARLAARRSNGLAASKKAAVLPPAIGTIGTKKTAGSALPMPKNNPVAKNIIKTITILFVLFDFILSYTFLFLSRFFAAVSCCAAEKPCAGADLRRCSAQALFYVCGNEPRTITLNVVIAPATGRSTVK